MDRTRVADYLAECLWPGVTESGVIDADARAIASASDTEDDIERVHYLGSILIPEDEVVFFFFTAASPAAVERVARRARLPFDRVLRSIRVSSGLEK